MSGDRTNAWVSWVACCVVLVALVALVLWPEDESLPPAPIPPPERPSDVSAVIPAPPPRPTPPPPPEQQVPPPQPVEVIPEREKLRVLVRDLADGQPVAGLRLRVFRGEKAKGKTPSGDDLESEVTTDEEGWTQLLPDRFIGLFPLDGEWKRPRYNSGEVLQSGVLWLYRVMKVAGSVRGGDERRSLDPKEVSLSVYGTGERGGDATGSPWNTLWLVSHGLGAFHRPGQVSREGTFSFTIPRVRGLSLTATSPAFRPASSAIPVPSLPGAVSRVDLVLLKSSIPIVGVLRSSTGRPLAGTRVTAYVTIITTADAIDRSKLVLNGHNYKLSIHSKTGVAKLVYLVSGRTNTRGEFRLESNVQGDVMLVVWPLGSHAFVRNEVGFLPLRGIDQVELTARHVPDSSRVRFLWNGSPLSRKRVTMSDISVLPAQPTFAVNLFQDGSMSTSWLDTGHRYTVHVDGGPLYTEITWENQKEIELGRPRPSRGR